MPRVSRSFRILHASGFTWTSSPSTRRPSHTVLSRSHTSTLTRSVAVSRPSVGERGLTMGSLRTLVHPRIGRLTLRALQLVMKRVPINLGLSALPLPAPVEYIFEEVQFPIGMADHFCQ